MASVEGVYFQYLELNGVEIPLARLLEGTYIECTDLSGPKVILRLNDMDSGVRDDGGLSEGSSLKVTLGLTEGDAAILELEFIVISCPYSNKILTINGLLKEIYDLKQKAVEPKFYVEKPVTDIIEELIPLPANSDPVPLAQTYHLTPDITPAQLIRKIERENNLIVYVSRGELYIHNRAEVMKGGPVMTFEHQNEAADNQIRAYTVLRKKDHYQRQMSRQHVGWSMVDGPIVGKGQGAVVVSSLSTQEQLDSLPSYTLPLMEFNTGSNDSLAAGLVIKLVMHRFRNDTVIDESLPESVLVTRVCHHQYSSSHTCLVEVGVPSE